MGPPYGKIPGILMGIVLEAYHKGVPLLRVPEKSTDQRKRPYTNHPFFEGIC